jgi:hypothetical protein
VIQNKLVSKEPEAYIADDVFHVNNGILRQNNGINYLILLQSKTKECSRKNLIRNRTKYLPKIDFDN